MKQFIIISFMILSISLYANDSRVVSFGNVKILQDRRTSVKIEEEKLEIFLHKNNFEVKVSYRYQNSGEEETILLGFPIEASVQEYDLSKVKIDNFKTVFNGKEISNFKESVEQEKENFYYKVRKWFIREVVFPANCQSNSVVNYRSSYSHGGFNQFAEYVLGSAVSWKSPIEKLTITLHIDQDVMVTMWKIATFNDKTISNALVAIEDGFEFVLKDYNPKLEDKISFYITEYSPMEDYKNEFGDMNEGWIWNKYHIYKKSPEEILLYSKKQLQLFINFFYAYRGYNFKNKELKNFFINNGDIFYDSDIRSYRVNPNFKESDFNQIEHDNIEYLKKLIQKLYE